MDSLDLFKKLTTNLSFSKADTTAVSKKRKLSEINDHISKIPRVTEEPSAPVTTKKAKGNKKKDLVKINQERVNIDLSNC